MSQKLWRFFMQQCSRVHVFPMQWGGLPLVPGRAVPFGRPKGTKNRQGASPPGTPMYKEALR